MSDPASPGGPWWAAEDPADGDLAGYCVICGATLVAEPGDVLRPSTGPMCGACTRAREFDQTLWELDLAEPDAGLW